MHGLGHAQAIVLAAFVIFADDGCTKLATQQSTESTSSSTQSSSRTLRLGKIRDFRTLSPSQNDGGSAGLLGSLIFSYLERIAPDGTLVPELARVVPTRRNGGISADGRTITYHLVLDFIFPTNTPSTRIMAVEIQQQLARLGVRIDLHAFTSTQFWAHAEDGGPLVLGKYDFALVDIRATPIPTFRGSSHAANARRTDTTNRATAIPPSMLRCRMRRAHSIP